MTVVILAGKTSQILALARREDANSTPIVAELVLNGLKEE